MPASRVLPAYRPSLIGVLFCLFMAALWIAGGASNAFQPGQIVVRLAAATVLVIAVLFGPRPAFGPTRPVWMILVAAILLAMLQLVPLPPAVWQSLPGRDVLAQAVEGTAAQPWRPLALVPGATVNAVFSLIVPTAMLLLLSMVQSPDDTRLLPAFLVIVAAAALPGLLQLSGQTADSPLVNETVGAIGGNFANRNHFALFMALGCLSAPVWAFQGGHFSPWRVVAGGGLTVVFLLIILGTGSRAGLGLGAIALVLGLAISRDGLTRSLRHLPKWALPVTTVVFLAVLAIMVFASMMTDRAAGIRRLASVDMGQDMRGRGLPIVWSMIREYFPAGSGLGGFDPVFRLHEPLSLLKPTYFNHAHNDFIEIVLDAGIAGLLLLVAAILWWFAASVRVWRATPSHTVVTGRLGSAILLLVLLASAFDYPARTPIVMATVVMAAVWLCWGYRGARSALPPGGRHL